MPRKPIAIITDHFGDEWDVYAIRDTVHPFPVYLGRPAAGRGDHRGGNRVVLTSELAAHLERHRRDSFAAMRLPIGESAIKRLRRLLGHHRYLDAAAWWEERFGDLCTLTLDAFATKHGVKPSTVERARLLLVGRTNRENGWWKEESIRTLLASDAPAAAIGDELGIPAGSVRKLRCFLRAEDVSRAGER